MDRLRRPRRTVYSFGILLVLGLLGGASAEANCNNEESDIHLDQLDPLLVIGVDPATGPLNPGVAVVCVNSSAGVSLNVGGGANVVDPDPSRIGFGLVPKICLTTTNEPCTQVGTQPVGAEVGTVSSPLCVGNTTLYLLATQFNTGPQGLC